MKPLFGPKTQLWFAGIALLLQPMNASALGAGLLSAKWAVFIAALLGGVSNVLVLLAKFGTPSTPTR